ncbi:4'-phosphopantetheinyl transferase superfamily protein [Streptomyces sp. NPDC093252]|uniref:4'-phosphopantetheinyl transferase family protein n=1 Tax=Streptomyces sp. NPDC093252 TaxID=3154980 RepID=UPI0034445DB9
MSADAAGPATGPPDAPVEPVEPVLLALADWDGLDPDPARTAPAERALTAGLPPWRRRELLIGRLTARAALTLRHGDRAARAELLRDSASKAPRLRGLPRTTVSLSHTGDRVAVAVGSARHRAGVDVERSGRCRPALLRRVLAPGEAPLPGQDPTVHWALKEAAYKAVLGRWAGLRAYRVRWTPHGPRITAPAGPPLTGRVWCWDGTVVAVVMGPGRYGGGPHDRSTGPAAGTGTPPPRPAATVAPTLLDPRPWSTTGSPAAPTPFTPFAPFALLAPVTPLTPPIGHPA